MQFGGRMHEARALIADDHELFSWALDSLLRHDLQFDHVQIVSSFQDTLEALKADRSQRLLCLDLSMPGMNGFESVRTLKAAAPPGMLVVVVSASTRRDDVAEAIKVGMNGYIFKTMRTPEIAEAIRMVLQGHVFIPPMIAQLATPESAERRTTPPVEDRDDLGAGDSTSRGDVPLRHWSQLTTRQRAVGELLVRGKSNKEIAIALNLAEGTVKAHVAALFRELNVRNRTEAVTAMMRMRSKSA